MYYRVIKFVFIVIYFFRYGLGWIYIGKLGMIWKCKKWVNYNLIGWLCLYFLKFIIIIILIIIMVMWILMKKKEFVNWIYFFYYGKWERGVLWNRKVEEVGLEKYIIMMLDRCYWWCNFNIIFVGFNLFFSLDLKILLLLLL